MGRLIALVVWAVLVLWLFWFSRNPKVRTSKALWIPTMWLFFGASRNVSEWLQRGGGVSDYSEGSALDRNVFTAILALGVIVLVARRRRVGAVLRSNAPILLYFFYCGISVLWSDFPDVAGKRWFRACGDIVMILIVLTEPDWLGAFKRVLTRLGFMLVPLSILFIRYFPELGRRYSRGGQASWVGVATDKNALGMICLVFGLAAIFRFLVIYRQEEGNRKTRPLIAQGVLIAMTAYLIKEANSATAFACFLLAGGVMVLTCLFPKLRKPALVHLMVAAGLSVAFSALFLGIGSNLVNDLGRESTLTGRTTIWHFAFQQVRNPILGEGFESFWLGSRLHAVRDDIGQALNQAHNGYLEIYFNLGWVGVVLLAVLIISGYHRIIPAVRRQTQAGSLRLAYFIITIAYNFTEAGFKMMHPVWIIFLLSIAVVPRTPILQRPKMSAQLDSAPSLADRSGRLPDLNWGGDTSPDFATPLTSFTSE